MRWLAVAVAVVVLGAHSAQAAPITYAFSTVWGTEDPHDPRNPAFTEGYMRQSPSSYHPGPDGRFSYDPATGVFSLSFQTSLVPTSPGAVVDLSDAVVIPSLAGEPEVLNVDFGAAAIAAPYSSADGAYQILSFGSLQLLLAGSGLTTNGTIRSGLVDANLTHAVFELRYFAKYTPTCEGCTASATYDGAELFAMLNVHQVPEPTVPVLAFVVALVLAAQTIRPARSSV